MSKGRVQTLERGFVTHGSSSTSSGLVTRRELALDVGELAVGQGEGVVAPRIEVRVQIDPIEHILDQLLEENARRDADAASQAAGNSDGQAVQVGVVHALQNALRGGGAAGVDIAGPSAPASCRRARSKFRSRTCGARGLSNRCAPEKSTASRWGERRQALHPLRALEERGGSP